MKIHQGLRKPPVYKILEIGVPKTRKDLRTINEVLETFGATSRLHFSNQNDMDPREGYPVPGTVFITKPSGYSRYSDELKHPYLTVSPEGNVGQTSSLDHFTLI